MTIRSRFSLKTVLVIIAVLAVPLGMVGTWELTKMVIALSITPPIVGGCLGYLIAGWKGAMVGVVIGIASDIFAFFVLAVWVYATGEPIYIPAY